MGTDILAGCLILSLASVTLLGDHKTWHVKTSFGYSVDNWLFNLKPQGLAEPSPPLVIKWGWGLAIRDLLSAIPNLSSLVPLFLCAFCIFVCLDLDLLGQALIVFSEDRQDLRPAELIGNIFAL